MNQIPTDGIILGRTNYGEADRILTVLTPEHGKLRLMARGVRKVKSKLAGGVELFSTSQLTYIEGRGEIGTLISSRLQKYYGRIVKDIERVQLGYELIKLLDKTTEDHPEAAYYHLMERSFAALDDSGIDLELIRAWFQAQLLKQAGHGPNLTTDTNGQKLVPDQNYTFDLDAMTFMVHPEGKFTAGTIKVLRLLFSDHPPAEINNVQGLHELLATDAPLVRTMLQLFVRT